MKFSVAILVLVAVSGPCTSPASAAGSGGGFRCESGRLVSLGDHMVEILTKCGDPDFVTHRIDLRKMKVKLRRWVSGRQVEIDEEHVLEIQIDEWVYDLGPGRFIRYVSFENARVVSVAKLTLNSP